MTSPAAGDVARAWVEHLRGAGTTPWRQWAAGGSASPPADRGAGPTARSGGLVGSAERLPGAAQLELVRRLARRHAQDPLPGLDFAALADRVLARPGPGRGRPDLPLAWPVDGSTPRSYGAPPVDPGTIPPTELVRVGVGVLADLLVEAPPGRRTRRRRRPFSPSFHLAGAPVSVRQLRGALVSDGRVPGGRKPVVLVLTAPLDDALQQAWATRAARGSEARWATYVLRRARTDRLPPAADASRAADRWVQRVGADRVHVLVGRHDDPAVRRTAAEILGVRVPTAVPTTGPSTPAEVDVVRRLNAVLMVRLPGRRHRTVLRRGLPGLFDGSPHPPLALPEASRTWAHGHAARIAEALAAGGYAVHGDLAEVTSLRTDTVARPQPGRVLDATLTACLRAAARQQERDGGRATR